MQFSRYSRCSSLGDGALLDSFEKLVRQDIGATADLVAHIAEIDKRRLWAPAGCASMYDYCKRVWHMSEDMAYKRIRAARAARRFPVLLDALADGRLHLAGIVLLAPCLTSRNADELVAAATHKSRAGIELLLAQRFPRLDVPTSLTAVTTQFTVGAEASTSAALQAPSATAQVAPDSMQESPQCMGQLAPGPVVPSDSGEAREAMGPVAPQGPGGKVFTAPGEVADAVAVPAFAALPVASPTVAAPGLAPRARIAPRSPGRYVLQVTIDQETHDLLQQAKALLAHQLPAGDIAEVLKRALDVLVARLGRTKFAETDAPRARRSHANGRYIPATIRRAVWERDGGCCAFVGEDGRRCDATSRLEFDHATPVARGGTTTVENLRLRCRAHNLLEAERAFGAGFMQGKREHGAAARAAP